MNVRWTAVIFGWSVDFALSLLLQMIIALVGVAGFFDSPSLFNPIHLTLMLLFVAIVGVGGFAGARMAGGAYALHGFLVGVADIVTSALLNSGYATPRPFIVVEILGCAAGALGGLIALRLRRAS
ncbi:MAG: TIGR04086 family membrane protein [Chloroflexales bacterium]